MATLPNGLVFNPSTGAITGTPTVAGTTPINIRVTDAAGNTALLGIQNLVVNPAPSTGADIYQIASNRFAFPTDWGNNGSANAATASTESVGQNGGSGTLNGRYNFRAWRFSTTWESREGRFLWVNAIGQVYGIYEGKTPITIQKVEVRKASDLSLAATVTWGGVGSKVLAAAERVWNDPIATLAPNTEYFCDVYWTQDDLAPFPVLPPMLLRGEFSASSLTNNYATATSRPTSNGLASSALGGSFGPARFAAKGYNGEAVIHIFGDSIEDKTTLAPKLLGTRGDASFIGLGLGGFSTPLNYGSAARYSQNMDSLLTNGLVGSTAKAVIDWVFGCDKLLQDAPLASAVINQHLRNNMSTNADISAIQTLIKNVHDRVRSFYPNMPFVQLTCDPAATAPQYYAAAPGVTQTPSGPGNSAGGTIQKINELIERNGAAQSGETLIANFPTLIGVDVSSPLRDPADYGKWVLDPFNGVLADAVTANSTNVIRVMPNAGSPAPAVGDTFVFEQGTTNAELGSRNFTVFTVTGDATAGYTCTGTGSSRNAFADGSQITEQGRLAKAHAAGSAVNVISCSDFNTGGTATFIHAVHKYQLRKAAKLMEKVPQIRAAARAYAATLA